MVEGSLRNDVRRDAPGLMLLFASGDRPDRIAIDAAIDRVDRLAISFDPQSVVVPAHAARTGTEPEDDPYWLELIADGLTFDLFGYRPSRALSIPRIANHAGLAPTDLGNAEAIGLFPGPHIAEGAHTLPVMRTLARIAQGLAQSLPGVLAIVWPPAQLAVAPKFFEEGVRRWLEGGPFPGPCFIGFRSQTNGGLETVGLAFLIDRELEVSAELALDRGAAARLVLRLVDELVGSELPDEARAFAGPDGAILLMENDAASGRITIRSG